MERRRERSGGILLMLAALIVAAAVWLLWTVSAKDNDDPAKNAVLVFSEGEAHAHG